MAERTRIKGMLTAARKLQEDIVRERERSGRLHKAGALFTTDMYMGWVINHLETHQRVLEE